MLKAIVPGLLLLLGGIGSPAFAEPADALPPGPKETLSALVGEDSSALTGMLGRTQSVDEWRAALGAEDDLGLQALADYLALNLPVELPEGDARTLIAELPADGKELFVDNCFSCHGVARYYLLVDKSSEEWMAIFDAPYHRRLLTGGVERETFSSYAATMMPIEEADIPAEWQVAQ